MVVWGSFLTSLKFRCPRVLTRSFMKLSGKSSPYSLQLVASRPSSAQMLGTAFIFNFMFKLVCKSSVYLWVVVIFWHTYTLCNVKSRLSICISWNFNHFFVGETFKVLSHGTLMRMAQLLPGLPPVWEHYSMPWSCLSLSTDSLFPPEFLKDNVKTKCLCMPVIYSVKNSI